MEVESISPLQHGPLSGETLVTINGKRLNGTSTYCKFGESKIVMATSSSYGVAGATRLLVVLDMLR